MAKYQLDMGVRSVPVKAVFYGPEGIGKSTLAAQMPNPVFIDVEGGTNQLPVARFPRPTSWQMLLDEVREVRGGAVPCSSLVIDTVDAAEELCRRQVVAKNGWENIETPGFGKGFTVLAAEFARLLDLLSEVTERGVSVILLGHSIVGNVTRPDESTYTIFTLNLVDRKNASVNAMVKAWADMLLFLDWKVYVTTDKSGKGKASGGGRVIRTTHSAAWDAKNRFGLPDEMPLDDASAARIASLLVGGEALREAPAAASAAQAPAKAEDAAPAPTTEVDRHIDSMDADLARMAPPKAEADPRESYPEHMAALADLMRKDGVTDAELRAAVASKGYFPEACPAPEYPADFSAWLVSVWPSFLKQVETLRVEPPFYSKAEGDKA